MGLAILQTLVRFYLPLGNKCVFLFKKTSIFYCISLLQRNSENGEKRERKFLNYKKILLCNKIFFKLKIWKIQKIIKQKTIHKLIDVYFGGQLDGSAGKESTCNAGDSGDAGSTPGLGSFTGGRNGNPLHYS